ncbi:DUF7638 domain-containing protein [Mucilaginibacter kameinonensis]|uniref:DUF7638 domain-containing protein n=1 Tax=Mucilaginibacter kameinonensis TaxID=452286 RepID=UPI000EF76533|nr:hypothetical protein [Mucilaginibacter kameinonensis]
MKLFDKIFNTNTVSPQPEITKITRTEIIEGFSLPGIIHNIQYHFTGLQVYSDGLISCWEMVDLTMLKEKIERGWLVTSIPEGEAISIHNLGHWYIKHGEWEHSKESLYNLIHTLVKQLNPTLENLHNYNGNNSKKIGKANIAKHFIPNPKPYYYEDPNSFVPRKISGEKFHFFFRNDDEKTYLAELSIYKNGHVEITNLPVKKTLKFEELNDHINRGIITTKLKTGETVTILNLGSFKVKSGNGVDIKHKMNELADKLSELNGRENSIAKCARIFAEYKAAPSVKLRYMLRDAYESVPEHQRIFVGTMDTKDYEVRQVIYGNKVKKEFEAENGYDYPYDDMPQPIDEE